MTEANAKQVPELIKVLKDAGQEIPADLLQLERGGQKYSESYNVNCSFLFHEKYALSI